MTILLVLPLLIPLVVAALSLITWRRMVIQRALALLGSLSVLGVACGLLALVWRDGVQAVQIGDWEAPFGITLVADTFSAIMVVLAATMGLVVNVYSTGSIDRRRGTFGYYPLLQVMMMGVYGAFLTGDIFNLFVWFEVMLIASFVLLALGGERPQLEGSIKYVTLNLLSSALFLAAVGILYGIAGTLNMADLAVKLRDTPDPGLITTVAMLFLISFGIKAAVFPLFFWLPASYHTPPVAVSAIFAGLLTKVGVYALIRVFTLLFTQDTAFTHDFILIVAGLTMVTGVLGAVAQEEFRRILSFHIVSQIGYMIMGLGLFTTAALAASVFYIIHHIIVKTNLFLISGVAQMHGGSFELERLGGLYRSRPLLSFLFLIPAFSLAGVPPLSGFFGKLALVEAGFATEQYAIVAVSLAVSVLTLFSMTKIWAKAFWSAAPEPEPDAEEAEESDADRPSPLELMAPIMVLALFTVALGLLAEPTLALSNRAAEQLMDPTAYIEAVAGANE